MAVVLIEGFDHLLAANLTSKGWTVAPNSMQAGRFDGQCARATSAAIPKALPSTYSTLFGGFAWRVQTVASSAQDLFFVRDTAGGTNLMRIGYDATGKLSIRNSGGTVIATGTTVLTTATWYYIEFKLVIAGASGTIEIHLNGASEITTTTGNFGSTNAGAIVLQAPGTSGNSDYDDLYILDTTGSAPQNTFLGDVRVETIYPTADGNHTQWTPNSGSTHYTQVDEAQADGDTSYVSDSTPGDLDTYAFGDIDTGATVFAVQRNIYARKDDANTRQIAPVTRQSGTDYVGTTVTLSSSYVTYSQLDNQDPTGSNWTPTTVNADEFGVKEIA